MKNNKSCSLRIGYGLGSGSDFLAFDQLVGSSNYDASYTFNSAEHRNIASYPLYHTSYELFSMVKEFVDQKFTVKKTAIFFCSKNLFFHGVI